MNRSVPCVQELREMGDSYARNEFKAHKKAQIGQVKMFAKEWKEYVYTIELQAGQGPGAFGRHLDESKGDGVERRAERKPQTTGARGEKSRARERRLRP